MDNLARKTPGADVLSLRRYRQDGHLVIEAIGELTVFTVGLLAVELLSEEGRAAARITLDLRRVSLVEGSILRLLVQESKRLRSAEVPLAPRVLVTPGKQPARALRLGAFDKILEVIEQQAEFVQG